jgi:hypothetical protein
MAKSAKDPRPAAQAPADVNDPGLASAPADAPAETPSAEEVSAAAPVDAAAEAPPAEVAPEAAPVDVAAEVPSAEPPEAQEPPPDASAATPAPEAPPAEPAPAQEAPPAEPPAPDEARATEAPPAEAAAVEEAPPAEPSAPAAAPFTISLPALTEQALLYTAVSLDSASGLQVQMVLHMDRLPHRWQAVYSAPGPNPITYEQYMQMKAMHLELEQALVRVLRDASWQEPNAESWLAPWEAGGAA